MLCSLTFPVLGSVIAPLLPEEEEEGVGPAVVSSSLLSSVCVFDPPPPPPTLVLVVGGFLFGGLEEGAGLEGGCDVPGGAGTSVVVAGGLSVVGCCGGSTGAGGDGFGAGGVSEDVAGAGVGVLGAGVLGRPGMRPPSRSRFSIATARAVVLGRMDTRASDTAATVVRKCNCIAGEEYILDITVR